MSDLKLWDAATGQIMSLPPLTFTGPGPMDTPIFDALFASWFYPLRWVLGANQAIEDLDAGRPSAFMPHYVWYSGTGRIEFNPGGVR